MESFDFVVPSWGEGFSPLKASENEGLKIILENQLGMDQTQTHKQHSVSNVITGIQESSDLQHMSEEAIKEWLSLSFPPSFHYFAVLSLETNRFATRVQSCCVVPREEYSRLVSHSIYPHTQIPALLFPCVTFDEAQLCVWAILCHLVKTGTLFADPLKRFSVCLSCYFKKWRTIRGSLLDLDLDLDPDPNPDLDQEIDREIDLSEKQVPKQNLFTVYKPVYLPTFWMITENTELS